MGNICEHGETGAHKVREAPPYDVWCRLRLPRSPVGPGILICEGEGDEYGHDGDGPCGHSWADHDDFGCLYWACGCWLPGERK